LQVASVYSIQGSYRGIRTRSERIANDREWSALRGTALTLAESGNVLMMDKRGRDQGDRIKDSKMLVDVGAAAYKAAQAKDLNAILARNEQLSTACITCHQQYRAGYRKRQ
jgi:hypothetical protein